MKSMLSIGGNTYNIPIFYKISWVFQIEYKNLFIF